MRIHAVRPETAKAIAALTAVVRVVDFNVVFSQARSPFHVMEIGMAEHRGVNAWDTKTRVSDLTISMFLRWARFLIFYASL